MAVVVRFVEGTRPACVDAARTHAPKARTWSCFMPPGVRPTARFTGLLTRDGDRPTSAPRPRRCRLRC